MGSSNTIVVILVIMLFALTGYNIYYLTQLKRMAKKAGRQESDSNYFKLDAKIELFKYLTLGIIAVTAFFGYSEFSKIDERIEIIEKLDRKLDSIGNKSSDLDGFVTGLRNHSLETATTQESLEKRLNQLALRMEKQEKEFESAMNRIANYKINPLAEFLTTTMMDMIINSGYIDGVSKEYILLKLKGVDSTLKQLNYTDKERDSIINEILKNPYVVNKPEEYKIVTDEFK